MPSRILRLWNPDVAAWEEVGDSRLSVHLAAGDPHPQYLTAAEGTGQFLPLTGGTLTGALTLHGATASTNVLQAKLAADTQPRLRANASGLLEWGPGGATAPSLLLSRNASFNALELEGRLIVSGTSSYLRLAASGAYLEVPQGIGNPATTGSLRLVGGAGGAVAWRNQANTADLTLTRDTTDRLAYSGTTLVLGGDATLARTGAGALRLDKYLGVGANPAAWAASEPGVVQVGTSAHREGSLSFNTYYDGTTNRAIAPGAALTMSSQSGQFYFYNAPSVAAGAAQTFTQRLLVSAAGTLTVSPDAGQPALLAGGTVTAAAGTNLALTSQGGNNVVVDPAGNVFAPNRNNAISNGAATLLWTVVYATQGTISTSSREAKEDITPLDPALALEAVRSTPAVTFTYTAPERPPEWYDLPDDPEQAEQVLQQRLTAAPLEAAARQQAGFVAEDCAPLFLTGEGQTNPSNTSGVLLAALQELDRRLTALEGA